MAHITRTLIVATVFGLLLEGKLLATPTIGATETWNPTAYTWGTDVRGGTGISGDQTGGDFKLTFDATPGSTRKAVIWTEDANLTGAYLGQPSGFAVSFKVQSYDEPISQLGLYFSDAGGTGNEWVYYLNPPSAGNSSSYKLMALQDAGQWFNLATGDSGNEDLAWSTDFATVGRFGIYVVEGAGFGAKNYGLDDVNLSFSVPEPESVWLIIAALASLGVTFRGKVSDSVRGLIKRA
jgi:hypothetical protein